MEGFLMCEAHAVGVVPNAQNRCPGMQTQNPNESQPPDARREEGLGTEWRWLGGSCPPQAAMWPSAVEATANPLPSEQMELHTYPSNVLTNSHFRRLSELTF